LLLKIWQAEALIKNTSLRCQSEIRLEVGGGDLRLEA
jgi:hypothetical protein